MTHYYTDNSDLPSKRKEFACSFGNEEFCFTTDLGVFSKDRVDFGSSLLIRSVIGCGVRGKVLDLGCGYGPVGIVLKRFYPEAELTLVDVNPRALELSQFNAARNHTDLKTVLTSDILELEDSFDAVVLNPPIRAGKDTVFSLYEKAYEKLVTGGCLYIVIQKKQGAGSSKKKLETLFEDVTVLDHDRGYFVYRARKQ